MPRSKIKFESKSTSPSRLPTTNRFDFYGDMTNWPTTEIKQRQVFTPQTNNNSWEAVVRHLPVWGIVAYRLSILMLLMEFAISGGNCNVSFVREEGLCWIHPLVLQNLQAGDHRMGQEIVLVLRSTYTYDTFPYHLLPAKRSSTWNLSGNWLG